MKPLLRVCQYIVESKEEKIKIKTMLHHAEGENEHRTLGGKLPG